MFAFAAFWIDSCDIVFSVIAAGLNVSTNTPLCTLNEDYIKTLEFIKDLGVTYATCSGLIITGNARTRDIKYEKSFEGNQKLKTDKLQFIEMLTRFWYCKHVI